MDNEYNDMVNMANAIRVLSVDAIQKAASGHPGMPLGMADVATVLFAKFLKFNPKDPNWFDRDRFVLSNGHGSMLLYSILYFLGCLDIEEIKRFRQIHSLTPGHPEYGYTPGVDATTGPLGQGLACAVGMAIAEKILSEKFGSEIVNHTTYVMVGDGCLMEGISHEAASLAGHLQLNKLIVLFDDNNISIDGPISLSVSDDVKARFLSYQWDVFEIDGHDFGQIESSIKNAQKSEKPSLICCKTVIGKHLSSKENTCAAHSWPFSEEEVMLMKEKLNWQCNPFNIPEEILQLWKNVSSRSEDEYNMWLDRSAKYSKTFDDFVDMMKEGVPDSVFLGLKEFKKELYALNLSEATRRTSGRVLEVIAKHTSKLIGGSADLTNSNNTKPQLISIINRSNFNGSYLHYGIREHAMAGCMNGMALHGGMIPYGGTFLVFSDYCRPAIRLSALMKKQVIYIMTHDSIGVGEDGPTHQPIEHLSSLRSIPNLYVFRPADAIEVLECWEIALKLTSSPSVFILSRQNVGSVRSVSVDENLSNKGAYVIREYEKDLDVTIFATGSEVEIALKASDILKSKGLGTRVVSIPCWELFVQQDKKYIFNLLNNKSIKAAVEAASSFGWHRYIGENGIFVGLEDFGISAPYKDLYKHFGITAEGLVNKILDKLKINTN
ncbi:transketolase [Ehrlichia chaffeensis str. Liberty]|uniref:transketolase n=1 Tax=Ehrlichia chaffeensis TaxID=945 RepID=UPI000444EA90|nr:transketolase [Ehrlichia chaffeensis]AHX05718.1 transketolase [Ehrlichia chaffeensis str. Jax]AHX06710.1 transketolase [Ehrlichia chaffeensis str. Liberty]AHX07901.1 transketolase [Ehrlichia chaffeensis str. Osceola]